MAKRYDPILCMLVEDNSVKTKDADPIKQRRHEIVVRTENYLKSIGKNNSTGKYDRVVQGVKSLLASGYLEGADLERAIKREADRLLQKYNANDSVKNYDSAKSDLNSIISQLEKAIRLINQNPSDAAYEIASARANLVRIAASKARDWGYNVTKANDRSSLKDNDLKDVREAIGFLKNANSKLGMIDNRFVQTCKNKIADCIATLEKV